MGQNKDHSLKSMRVSVASICSSRLRKVINSSLAFTSMPKILVSLKIRMSALPRRESHVVVFGVKS